MLNFIFIFLCASTSLPKETLHIEKPSLSITYNSPEKSPKAAQLRIYADSIQFPMFLNQCLCSTIVVYATQPFNESAITWNNRPQKGKSLAAYKSVVAPTWYSWTSTGMANYVDSLASAGKDTIPFLLEILNRNGGICDVIWWLASRESSRRPELIYNSTTYSPLGDAWVTDGYPGGPDSTHGSDPYILVCSCTLTYNPDFTYRSGTQLAYLQFYVQASVEDKDTKNSFPISPFPNPFSSSISISYFVPKDGQNVLLEVYDITGKLVKTLVNEVKPSNGKYSINWDGRDFMGRTIPNGIYFYRLQTGDFILTEKLILIK